MEELIVFVNQTGQPTGETGPKLASHTANTKLHSAFSCYVFDDQGQFLVTQRAHTKKVWPGVWTNSVCGHPLPGESREDAIKRRLDYELGMTAKDLQIVLPNYTYKTPPYNGIIENEFCPVYVAVATSEPTPNPDEVADFKWLSWADFMQAAEADSDDYSWFSNGVGEPPAGSPQWSWWCKDQLKQLKNHPLIQKYSKG